MTGETLIALGLAAALLFFITWEVIEPSSLSERRLPRWFSVGAAVALVWTLTLAWTFMPDHWILWLLLVLGGTR